MKLRTGRLIKKRRYVVKAGKTEIEIDVFKGDHRGLGHCGSRIARRARARSDRPDWLGKEVTGEETILQRQPGAILISVRAYLFRSAACKLEKLQAR